MPCLRCRAASQSNGSTVAGGHYRSRAALTVLPDKLLFSAVKSLSGWLSRQICYPYPKLYNNVPTLLCRLISLGGITFR